MLHETSDRSEAQGSPGVVGGLRRSHNRGLTFYEWACRDAK